MQKNPMAIPEVPGLGVKPGAGPGRAVQRAAALDAHAGWAGGVFGSRALGSPKMTETESEGVRE